MRSKKPLLILTLLLLAFMVSGCAQQSYFVQVEDDSSVNFAAELTLPENGISKLKDLNIQREEILDSYEPLFTQIKKLYTEKGFDYEYTDSDGQAKVILKKFYPSIEDFNSENQELYESGLCGLFLNIDRDTSLSGSNTKYKGALRYQFDPEFVETVQSNPHLLKYVSSIPLSAYVRIYDSNDIVTVDSVDPENGQFATMVNGTWDTSGEQPTKTFFIHTESKNQTFALVVFFVVGAGILVLLVLVFGKGKKFDIFAFIKKKRLEREDN